MFYNKFGDVMKLFIGVLVALMSVSCQKETPLQEESSAENDLVQNVALNKMVLSVAAHDGSFDDIIDNSGCFSVKFPYQVLHKGVVVDILSINDLLAIEPGDSVSFQFPISITFSDYVEVQVTSEKELLAAQYSCASNQVFSDSIRCVDFMYPINIAVYNSDTSTFETLVIDHDRQNFQSVSAFILEQKASLNFPVSIQGRTGVVSQVNTVDELLDLVYSNEQNCGA